MCGIGAIISKIEAPIAKDRLDYMEAQLGARGPDGSGQYQKDNVGFVHTRLSIIDLEGSPQPMTNKAGCTLIFNGEIYNYKELRAELSEKYDFKTGGDTEVILALYQLYGVDFVSRLRGMYAFILHDPDKDYIIAARDPFGIKPLYYRNNDQEIRLASEIKALFDPEDKRVFDRDKFPGFLKRNYINDDNTGYENISRIRPGAVRVYKNGVLYHNTIIDALPQSKPINVSEQDALTQLNEIMVDTVSVHCRSDVGYGLFLSGGIDSTAIVVALSQLGLNNVRSYTAAFDVESAADEREFARQTAYTFGLDHKEIIFTEHDFWTLLPEIAAYMDDPVADYAILPTWKLAEEAGKEQKVVLCGEGGDELFAGYGRYKKRWWKDWNKKWNLRRDIPSYTDLQKRQAFDIENWLPNDLLIKLDMCLMAHGLEGRTPFLDKIVADFAFTLPDDLKRQGKHGKYILKKWLEQHYPAHNPFRKKQGFTVPVGQWIQNDRTRTENLIRQSAFTRDIMSLAELSRLGELSPMQLWPLLYLSFWARS